MRPFIWILVFTVLVPANLHAESIPAQQQTPQFLREEHNQIFATLERLAKSPGKTGKAARDLATVLRPHLLREERFVFPQLRLLKTLAFEKPTAEMLWAVELSAELKKEYPAMMAQHQAILKQAEELISAAELEMEDSAFVFANHLLSHIQDEEDIIYPAAILAGVHIKEALQG